MNNFFYIYNKKQLAREGKVSEDLGIWNKMWYKLIFIMVANCSVSLEIVAIFQQLSWQWQNTTIGNTRETILKSDVVGMDHFTTVTIIFKTMSPMTQTDEIKLRHIISRQSFLYFESVTCTITILVLCDEAALFNKPTKWGARHQNNVSVSLQWLQFPTIVVQSKPDDKFDAIRQFETTIPNQDPMNCC